MILLIVFFDSQDILSDLQDPGTALNPRTQTCSPANVCSGPSMHPCPAQPPVMADKIKTQNSILNAFIFPSEQTSRFQFCDGSFKIKREDIVG